MNTSKMEGRWFSPGTLVSSTNKTDGHDRSEILLKVALNTITLTLCCFVSGIGISMAIISLVVAIYYNVIMAYTLIYLFSSMQKTLPWTVCQDVSTICFNVLYRTRMDTLYNYLSIDHILLIV